MRTNRQGDWANPLRKPLRIGTDKLFSLAVIGLICGFPSPSMADAETLPTFDRVRILESPRPISDATLTSQDGQPFRLSSLRGRAALVLFGFTNCPDVCPIAMARMRQLEESGRLDPDHVAYVMISVDGERDTPAVVREFVRGYSQQFIGLTGDPAQVKPISKDFAASFFKGSVTSDSGDYSVSHSPQIFLIDSTGQLRAEFYNASIEAMSGVTLAVLEEAQANSKAQKDSE